MDDLFDHDDIDLEETVVIEDCEQQTPTKKKPLANGKGADEGTSHIKEHKSRKKKSNNDNEDVIELSNTASSDLIEFEKNWKFIFARDGEVYEMQDSVKEKKRKRPFSSEGTTLAGKVLLTMGEKGILWKQDAKLPVNFVATDNKAPVATACETKCIFYTDLVCVTQADSANDSSQLISMQNYNMSKSLTINIHSCQRYNGCYYKLVESQVSLLNVKDAQRWVRYTDMILDSVKCRVKNVRAYINTKAGKGGGTGIYKSRAAPLFKKFNINHEVCEINGDLEQLRADILEVDWSKYDAVVVVGGDGTVRAACSALLEYSQNIVVDMRPGSHANPCKTPICILPVGYQNDIARSFLGTADVTSSIIHLLSGHTKQGNMCSVTVIKNSTSGSKFLGWTFNCSYGLASNALTLLDSPDKYEKALGKALGKKNFCSYECDFYLKKSTNEELSHPDDDNVCYNRCSVCHSVQARGESGRRVSESGFSDLVVEIDPLAESNTSSTIIELQNQDQWSSIKGTYCWVGIYSIPGRSELFPLGLSKNAHLNDGCFDLVLVHDTKKRELVRYLKRMSSAKNQLDYTFVESFRCSSLRFQPRSKTWKHVDIENTEIDYDMRKIRSAGSANDRLAAVSVKGEMVIDELMDGPGQGDHNRVVKDTSAAPIRREVRSKSLVEELFTDSEEDETAESSPAGSSTQSSPSHLIHNKDEEVVDAPPEKKKEKKKKKLRLLPFSLKTTEAPRHDQDVQYVRPTVMIGDIDRQRREAKQKEKELKRRSKEDARSKSKWNMDYSLIDETEIEVTCHPNVLQIFCDGIFSDTKFPESKLSTTFL